MRGRENKHTRAFRAKRLLQGESVLAILEGLGASGNNVQKNGALLITDRRVAFLAKGIFGESFEAISRDHISSIEETSRFGSKVLAFHASGSTLRFRTREPAELVERARSFAEPNAHFAQNGHTSAVSPRPPAHAPAEEPPPERRSEPNGFLKWGLGVPFAMFCWGALSTGIPAVGYLSIVAAVLCISGLAFAWFKKAEDPRARRIVDFGAQRRGSLVFLALSVVPGSFLGISAAANASKEAEIAAAEQTRLMALATETIGLTRKDLAEVARQRADQKYEQASAGLGALSRRLEELGGLEDPPPELAALHAEIQLETGLNTASQKLTTASQRAQDGKPLEASQLVAEALETLDAFREQHEEARSLAAKLEELRLAVRDAAVQQRVSNYEGRIAAADDLYDRGEYEPARAAYFQIAEELEQLVADSETPPAFETWARDTHSVVDTKLSAAARAKEFPEAIEYFGDWRRKKRALEEVIRGMGSEKAMKPLTVQLAIPLAYLNTFESATRDQRSLVPSKFRSASFIKARRKEIEKLEEKANERVRYLRSCGSRPEHDGWDGGNSAVERLMEKIAHDPDSVDVENCTRPVFTTRDCWQYECDVRATNVFGAKVLNHVRVRQNASIIRTY